MRHQCYLRHVCVRQCQSNPILQLTFAHSNLTEKSTEKSTEKTRE